MSCGPKQNANWRHQVHNFTPRSAFRLLSGYLRHRLHVAWNVSGVERSRRRRFKVLARGQDHRCADLHAESDPQQYERLRTVQGVLLVTKHLLAADWKLAICFRNVEYTFQCFSFTMRVSSLRTSSWLAKKMNSRWAKRDMWPFLQFQYFVH